MTNSDYERHAPVKCEKGKHKFDGWVEGHCHWCGEKEPEKKTIMEQYSEIEEATNNLKELLYGKH